MIFFKILISILVTILMTVLLVHVLVASFDPALYGKYLQTMDDSRYEYIDRE